jgi:hypothetical protein
MMFDGVRSGQETIQARQQNNEPLCGVISNLCKRTFSSLPSAGQRSSSCSRLEMGLASKARHQSSAMEAAAVFVPSS